MAWVVCESLDPVNWRTTVTTSAITAMMSAPTRIGMRGERRFARRPPLRRRVPRLRTAWSWGAGAGGFLRRPGAPDTGDSVADTCDLFAERNGFGRAVGKDRGLSGGVPAGSLLFLGVADLFVDDEGSVHGGDVERGHGVVPGGFAAVGPGHPEHRDIVTHGLGGGLAVAGVQSLDVVLHGQHEAGAAVRVQAFQGGGGGFRVRQVEERELRHVLVVAVQVDAAGRGSAGAGGQG